jgi:CarD family transcriptional regulator
VNFFKIGDKVIYPNQGLGVIEDIQEVSYEGQCCNVYHLRLLSNNALVLIPSSNTEEFGIRKPILEKQIKKIFDFIKNADVDISMNWKGRYKEHLNLMKSGLMQDMILVLKSLFYLNLIKPLSFREKKMMEKVKELIVSEISEVSSLPSSKIEEKVMDILSICYEDVDPRVDS